MSSSCQSSVAIMEERVKEFRRRISGTVQPNLLKNEWEQNNQWATNVISSTSQGERDRESVFFNIMYVQSEKCSVDVKKMCDRIAFQKRGAI